MDLIIYAVILVVFLASFFSLLFISKLPRGKSFDEVLAEKRQLAEKLYGPNYGHKNYKNKSKKSSKKVQKVVKVKEPEQVLETQENDESDTEDNVELNKADNNDHLTHTNKGHVEFAETEIIATVSSFNNKSSKQNAAGRNKSNLKSSGSGILLNKSEPIPIKKTIEAEPLNHFEDIQPKDVVELKNSNQKNENENPKTKKSEKIKEGKKLKQKKVIDSIDTEFNSVQEIVESITISKHQENMMNNHSHEKLSKKKKIEFDLVQKLIDEREGINVKFLIPLLSKAELTRSEIQILIDFLLNKQQDTTLVDYPDWIEGRSDIVQKLKKQLSDKEKALQDEQDASIALHAKLRELRSEINNERAIFNANMKQQCDEINLRKLENQNLTSEIQFLKDKFNNEKQTLNVQMQHMQAKLLQEKKANSQEMLQKLQQLTDSNNVLSNEVINKNAMIHELNEKIQQNCKFNDEVMVKKISEYENKYKELERLIIQKDDDHKYKEKELITQRQRNQELNGEIQHLRNEICRTENKLQIQIEQYKQQIEQSKTTAHLDDVNKVEIRNLQNALDSSKTEINELRNELYEKNKTIDGNHNQIRDLKANINNFTLQNMEQLTKISEWKSIVSKLNATIQEKETKLSEYEVQVKKLTDNVDELVIQIEKEKSKNNDLRTKNWKLNEALQKVQTSSFQNDNVINSVDKQKSLIAEQIRIRQQLESVFTDDNDQDNTDFDEWLDRLKNYIQNKLGEMKDKENNDINHSKNNSFVENETKMNEIVSENDKLRKQLEKYRSLLEDTETILHNLERKSEEREIYWQGVVRNLNSKNLTQVSPLLY